ncbi:alpha/beta hydrolase [Nocardia goodfellowii]|uniref:S-formylglutathione hydrolase FrmB n=1 Tax=Nocardia goodfellowii TaxID=882446 RepID=A0ABS4QMG1_9NOCA|nr:alpha/beta hydrolase family protein [Nocardia goodfellowii]MBP2192278.1 S-formylglutathione hydrolase FrmB [Nocardia goodfellowii]
MRALAVAAVSIALLACSPGAGVATPGEPAEPIPARAFSDARPAPNGSHLLSAAQGAGRVVDLTVHSAAMARPVTVAVLPAADPARPAPVLYLLNGIDGGTDYGRWTEGSNWLTKTDAAQFFSDKQVTVVTLMGGQGSFYADWLADDPVLGRQQWTTFLTRELPPIVDSAFNGTGANAVAGLSMASGAGFRLALAAPGLYRAIGSYSGCIRTSDARGQAIVDVVVAARMGNARNMWGPPTHPAWAANDPYLHAEQLRGITMYVSTGTGLPGPLDTLDAPGVGFNPIKLVDQLLIGGALDAVTLRCTEQLRDRFAELAIPATFDIRPSGTHSWGYWQQDLHNSWSLFAAALGR